MRPGPASAETQDALRSRGLEAVLEPAARAGAAAQRALAHELAGLDWALLDRQRAALKAPPAGEGLGELAAPELAPPSDQASPASKAAAARGWEALRAGRVAVATVAGGQASRLGFEAPKGAYPLCPVSGASLFQILAGGLHRLRERAGVAIPWIIQTGPENHASTADFLRDRSWFGLGRDSVWLCCQGTLPALAPDGSLLLAAPGRLFRNPDGHGGFYTALDKAGALDRLDACGVDTLFYCQVDNPLAPVGDPAFLGHHLAAGASMSVKVVEKTEPAEKVGLVVLRDGLPCCIEYSDLPAALTAERAADGGLRFRAGNIAMHAFDRAFLAEMAAAELPFHLARKQVRALAADGGPEPVEREAVKFETFVFDALPRAGRVIVQLAERAEEFAPVKNRAGADSIATARAALSARARRWCAQALPSLQLPASGTLELEPGLALDAADLAGRSGELELRCGGHLLAVAR